MPTAPYTIHARHGDDLTLPIRIFDGAGRARNLAGATLRTIIRHGPTALADIAPANFDVGVTNAARGVVELRLGAAALPAGCYAYELDLLSGGRTEGLLHGQLIIDRGLT